MNKAISMALMSSGGVCARFRIRGLLIVMAFAPGVAGSAMGDQQNEEVHAVQPANFQSSTAAEVASPSGRVVVAFELNGDGVPRYSIRLDGRIVLDWSRLGVVRDDADFSRGLRLHSFSTQQPVQDRYESRTSKRRHNVYEARRMVATLAATSGQLMSIVFQASDDGAGFRYEFPAASDAMATAEGAASRQAAVREIREEMTEFVVDDASSREGARAWLQPLSESRTGWNQTNPSYEEFYQEGVPLNTPAQFNSGWAFPALFRLGKSHGAVANDANGTGAGGMRTDGAWVLVSETGLERGGCGARLRAGEQAHTFRVSLADPRETTPGGAANPRFTLPWNSPWRVIVAGDLATITESMLGVDLASPAPGQHGGKSRGISARTGPTRGGSARIEPDWSEPDWIEPGYAAWSWNLLKDPGTTDAMQRRFVDLASQMGWRYVLIDALWDTQIGYDAMAKLVADARAKDVRILLWYNSAGGWNTTPQTPRDKLVTKENRVAEFARLRDMGVAGVKVDFFGGDGSSMIDHYLDILDDAWDAQLLVNFHGCTIPRGWHRTYPHLMTMESARGMEYATFSQESADRYAANLILLPFTRNVFDPADTTPMFLDGIPGMTRRTTTAFELASAVVLTSGLTHFSEGPEGVAKSPKAVQAVLKGLPTVWDDVRFIDGFPGKFVVIARRAGAAWYIAGLNADGVERRVTITPELLGLDRDRLAGTLFADPGRGGSNNLAAQISDRRVEMSRATPLELTMKLQDGFLFVSDSK
ncbi:MAG: glycoside hydrolase family 97 catalytic domain-containing protein [Planctomycetota bacterium]|nr:glycoside hydrolase family 97 catalytic domain-containing protein [Planctomycetota bacterium]